MIDLKPCPMCGSPAEMDSTGAIECYGHTWQTLSIECTDVNGQHCGMDLSLSADFYYVSKAEEAIVTAWNALERKV